MASTQEPPPVTGEKPKDETELSTQYNTPMGLAHGTMAALKDRIKLHYDLASDYYLNLWGEHIHHGYYPTSESKTNDTKETAQINLIKLLLETAQLPTTSTFSAFSTDPATSHQAPLNVLDVGCGIGGTSRYLASELGAAVTGITISGKQVEMAKRLTSSAAAKAATHAGEAGSDADGYMALGAAGGKVKFLELDAERMGEYFAAADTQRFNVVWISEALSHFPNKPLFFANAAAVLEEGGKLVIADWFRSEDVAGDDVDIKAIEDGMLLPPLCTQQEYVAMAEGAGFTMLEKSGGPKDISVDVSQTWDITWSLIQNPSLWAFAFSQGRDGIAFLQAFRAMRRGYANGKFRYAVMAFQK